VFSMYREKCEVSQSLRVLVGISAHKVEEVLGGAVLGRITKLLMIMSSIILVLAP
jgi:hypothetical protein